MFMVLRSKICNTNNYSKYKNYTKIQIYLHIKKKSNQPCVNIIEKLSRVTDAGALNNVILSREKFRLV